MAIDDDGAPVTIEEIRDRYPAEWVLIGNAETNDSLDILEGKLLWHCKDRDELHEKAIELRPRASAIFYTGPFTMKYMLRQTPSTRTSAPSLYECELPARFLDVQGFVTRE